MTPRERELEAEMLNELNSKHSQLLEKRVGKVFVSSNCKRKTIFYLEPHQSACQAGAARTGAHHHQGCRLFLLAQLQAQRWFRGSGGSGGGGGGGGGGGDSARATRQFPASPASPAKVAVNPGRARVILRDPSALILAR